MTPDLSVVIPTLRRHVALGRALAALESQSGAAAGRFEVLVACDPERDDRRAVAAAVGDRAYPTRVVEAAGGVSAQRNAGWRAARGAVAVLLGDDVLASPGLLSAHLERHRRAPAVEVGVLGRVVWARELRVTPFMRFLESGIQFDFDRIEGDEAGWGRLYASNVSLKRELLDRAGGFDEAFTFPYEDLELGRRLHDLGLRLLWAPEAEAEHLHAPTVDEYAARMAATAVAERRMVAKHPDVPAYFHRMFTAAPADRASGRGERLARWVPRRVPWLGPRVHASAEAAWRRRLGEAFLSAWERDERDAQR